MSPTTRASAEASIAPTTKPAPTTTISVPPYSFDNSVPPPKLIQTGTDYKAILQSLLDYANWILASRPDAGLVGRVTAQGSKNQQGLLHDIGVLNRNNRRVYETNDGPAYLTLISTAPTAVTARYVQHVRRQIVVDPQGHVVNQRIRSEATTSYLVLMVRGTDSKWRLTSVTEQRA